MFYSSAEIDGDLACSYCKQNFIDVAKLVPGCGESICGDCYDPLMKRLNKSRKFECLACGKWHTMPDEGLTDVGFIRRMLKRRKVEKPLSEQAVTLKRQVEAMLERLGALKAFDKSEVVNEHYDRLEVEITEEFDSLVKHLNQIKSDLFKQVKEHREKSLKSLAAAAAPSCKSSKKGDSGAGAKKSNTELTALSMDVELFGSQWNRYFSRLDEFVTDSEIEKALKKTDFFMVSINSLEAQLKSEVFGGRMLQFRAIHGFFGDHDPLRSYFNLYTQENGMRIQAKPLRPFVDSLTSVQAFAFVSDDRFACASSSHQIKIWNVKEGALSFELQSSKSVVAIESLSNGWLASALDDQSICIWDLEKKALDKVLLGQTGRIEQLKSLRNGNLASYAGGDSIKIWNPYSPTNNLLQSISLDRWVLSMDSLLNGNLVALFDICSSLDPKPKDYNLKVWNSSNGRLVKSRNVDRIPSCMLVLSSGRIAFGTYYGTIKIIDMADESYMQVIKNVYKSNVSHLLQISDGVLVSAGECLNGISLKLWSLSDLSPLQTVETGLSGTRCVLRLSPDRKLLACKDQSHALELRPIVFE